MEIREFTYAGPTDLGSTRSGWGEYKLTDDSDLYTLGYKLDDDKEDIYADLKTDVSAKNALAERVDISNKQDANQPADNIYNGLYFNNNDVLVRYNKDGEIVYAISFNNYRSGMSYAVAPWSHWYGVAAGTDFAQIVWNYSKPAANVTYDTAMPTVTVAGYTISNTTRELVLDYDKWDALTTKNLVPVSIKPATGNQIAVNGQSTFTYNTVSTTIDLSTANSVGTITVSSQGNKTGAITVTYTYTVKIKAADPNAGLKVSDSYTGGLARIRGDKFGFIDDVHIEYSELKEIFVAASALATTSWTYISDAGVRYVGDDIPDDADIEHGTWTVTVKPQVGAPKTYTLMTEMRKVSVANDTTLGWSFEVPDYIFADETSVTVTAKWNSNWTDGTRSFEITVDDGAPITVTTDEPKDNSATFTVPLTKGTTAVKITVEKDLYNYIGRQIEAARDAIKAGNLADATAALDALDGYELTAEQQAQVDALRQKIENDTPTKAAEAIAKLAQYDTVAKITADNYGEAADAVEAAKALKPSDFKDDGEYNTLQAAIADVDAALKAYTDALPLKNAKAEAEQALKDYVDAVEANTKEVPDVTAADLFDVLAQEIDAMKELDTVEDVMAYVSTSSPVGTGILNIWNKAVEIQAVKATIATVDTYEELTAAIANSKVKTIILADDIALENKITLSAGVTLDGNRKTIDASKVKTTSAIVIGNGCTVKDLTVEGNTLRNNWDSNYGIQAYGNGVKATLEGVTVTGFDAAILVNGAELTLQGTVNVSGNEFGGIEVSKGKDITVNAKLIVKGTVVNDTESDTAPTAWIPCDDKGADPEGSIEGVKWTWTLVTKDKDKGDFQLWYTIND